jgi:Holliday junction resolvase RusA-like endonuclease
MSHTVKIKPLSVNKAWQGRRFKTSDYKQYEKALLLILPKVKIPDGKLSVKLEYGFSSTRSDVDNPTKLIIDCFQKKYGFNDSLVYELYQKKVIVKKGQEYFKFEINEL